MRKPPKLWQWEARGNDYYVTIKGKQIRLASADTDPEIVRKLYGEALGMAQTENDGDNATVVSHLERYLDSIHPDRTGKTASTYEFRRYRLQSFTNYLKKTDRLSLTVAKLKPIVVHDWIAEHPSWGPGEQRNYIVSLNAALNWAEKLGTITRNPVKHYPVPKSGSRGREAFIEPEHYELMLKNCRHECQRHMFIALKHTGARPGELYNATADDLDPVARTLHCEEHKNKGKGKKRTIALSPLMVQLFTKLAERHPTGPLFRNTENAPWTGHVFRGVVRRLRRKLGLPESIIPYGGRHTFATERLKDGVSDTQVSLTSGGKRLGYTLDHPDLKEEIESIKYLECDHGSKNDTIIVKGVAVASWGFTRGGGFDWFDVETEAEKSARENAAIFRKSEQNPPLKRRAVKA